LKRIRSTRKKTYFFERESLTFASTPILTSETSPSTFPSASLQFERDDLGLSKNNILPTSFHFPFFFSFFRTNCVDAAEKLLRRPPAVNAFFLKAKDFFREAVFNLYTLSSLMSRRNSL